jgi:hypothetical protein
MKVSAAMLVLFTLAGCGSPTAVDGSLQEYVTDFELQCGYTLKYLDSIKLAHLPENVAGWCVQTWTPAGYVGERIEIDTDTWAGLTETQRTALMFHEALHCTKLTKDLYMPYDSKDWMFWMNGAVTDAEFWEAYPANHRKYCQQGDVFNK